MIIPSLAASALAATFAQLGSMAVQISVLTCQRRLNIDPPCRSNIDPGRVAGF